MACHLLATCKNVFLVSMMFQSDGQLIQEKSHTAQIVKQISLQSALHKQNCLSTHSIVTSLWNLVTMT
jgi:hypothetical protein